VGNDNKSWDFKWPGASNEVEGVLGSPSCCEVENGDESGGVSRKFEGWKREAK
jgi:hypothetical protein